MGNLKTLQIVGYKNSGKTTLMNRWIRLLKEKGLKVALLKHHGHPSPLKLPEKEADSVQYFQSGADISLVAGGGSAQLLLNEEPTFQQLKKLAMSYTPDVLLIEGFKKEYEKKVVLLKSEKDWETLQHLSNVQLVSSYGKLKEIEKIESYLPFSQIDQWFLNWLQEDVHETI